MTQQGTALAKRTRKLATPEVVAAIQRPPLELYGKWSPHLELGCDYEDHDNDGKLVSRHWPVREVNGYTKLVPEAACRALIAELDVALVPAVYDHAKALARTVMGRYAKRDLYDIEIYLFELTRVFGEAPADLGREASDILRTNVYLPNTADAKIVVDRLVAERKLARAQAKRHLAERKRRRDEAAKPKPDVVTPEQVDAILARHRIPKAGKDAKKHKRAKGMSAVQKEMQGARGDPEAMRAVIEKHSQPEGAGQ